MAYKVLDLHRDITGKRNGSVTVSVSFFVPKTHSPYQWYGQQDVEEIHRKQRYLNLSSIIAIFPIITMMDILATWRLPLLVGIVDYLKFL